MDNDYLKTLLRYYEGELVGEAYFCALAGCFDAAAEREKLALLATVERRTSEVVRPLVDKHDLVPCEEAVLKARGVELSLPDQHFSWDGFMTHITVKYPDYLENYQTFEKTAPEDDLPVLKRLTHHEVVLIDFAHKELARDPDSVPLLRRYIEQSDVARGRQAR